MRDAVSLMGAPILSRLMRSDANSDLAKGLVLHSDRGSQDCARNYQKLLKQFGMISAMSRKGDCWDNAAMESFWGNLKNMLVHHRHYHTHAQAIVEITAYSEIFHNRQRGQARVGYLSPTAFTQRYYANKIAA
jgi:putative transposase